MPNLTDVLNSEDTPTVEEIAKGVCVPTDVTGITGAVAIANAVSISQADYDNIVTPDANTMYVING